MSSSAAVSVDERLQPGAHRLRRADDRVAEHVGRLGELRRRQQAVDAPRRRERRGPAAARSANACCSDVNSRCASSSVSAATTLRPEHRVRALQLRRGLERLAVDLQRREQVVGREVRGERVRQPEERRQLRAEQCSSRGSRAAPARRRPAPHGSAGPAARARGTPAAPDVLRERLGGRRIAPQRPLRAAVGARRPAQAEVDAARIQRLERPELLGDHHRRVVGQHDAARADADRRGAAGQVADDDRGRRARDARACCGARPPRTGGSPAARRGGRGRGCGAARRRGVDPSVTGTRSRTLRRIMVSEPASTKSMPISTQSRRSRRCRCLLLRDPGIAGGVLARVVGVEVDEAALDEEVADLEHVAPATRAPLRHAGAPRAVLVLAVGWCPRRRSCRCRRRSS